MGLTKQELSNINKIMKALTKMNIGGAKRKNNDNVVSLENLAMYILSDIEVSNSTIKEVLEKFSENRFIYLQERITERMEKAQYLELQEGKVVSENVKSTELETVKINYNERLLKQLQNNKKARLWRKSDAEVIIKEYLYKAILDNSLKEIMMTCSYIVSYNLVEASKGNAIEGTKIYIVYKNNKIEVSYKRLSINEFDTFSNCQRNDARISYYKIDNKTNKWKKFDTFKTDSLSL